jgi:hypothetical protein
MKLKIKVDWAAEMPLPDDGRVFVDGGQVDVVVGRNSVEVAGNAGAVLDWLLGEYVADDLDGALEILGGSQHHVDPHQN